MFPPEIARRHRANVDLVCRTGDTLTTEVPEFLQESKRWIDTRLVPIKDASGRVTAVLGISRDVTRQRDIENALRESEANFRALAENALDGILICSGPDASCVYANESIAAMCGYSIHEFLQTPLQAIIPSEEVAVILDRYRRRVKGEVLPGRYEDRFRRKDGQIFPVELSLTRTIWQGQPATLAVARDISALKRSEEERRRLAANLLEVQEKERAQISFMLHDHLGQLLTLSRLELGSIRTQDEASKVSVDKALARLDDALHAVRRLAVSLRPPILDDLGIEVAIETLVEEFGESVNIQTAFRRNGPPPQLTKDQETSLYRVLQEALTNSAKHSDAGHIEVTLTTSLKSVTLEIRDDGKGFDMEKMHEHSGERGIGFIGMRERLARCGGELEMVSGEGKGTTILARIPAKGAPDKGSLE